MKYSYLVFFILSQVLFVNCQTSFIDSIFIRTNQVGFLPHDVKTAVVLSKTDLTGKKFFVVENKTNKVKYEGSINDSSSIYGDFNFCYQIDFSSLNLNGNYKLKLLEFESYPFQIGDLIFNDVRDSISLFFKAQRCGPTNPILHKLCHLSDASKVIGYVDSTSRDLTGGWHDAGDYIKLLKTTALTTYLLLFSDEFDPSKFEYDLNKDGVPDILEEAKVGLDWLLRCNIDNKALVSQVQDEKDHTVGWRLPENDSLQFDRPAFVSMGKNTIGIYVAALALASKIWKDRFYDNEFANECLSVAENFYDIRDQVQDIDSTYSNHYPEKDFNGKLALAAIELFNVTLKQNYLNDAIDYGTKARSDYWWSVGDINSLADFRIAQHNPDFAKYIYQNLIYFKSKSDSSFLREGLSYSWGTTNTFLGISLQAILYKNLTASKEFDSLAIYQRDYVLGRNPWGISFIYGVGSKYAKNLHSQVAYFNNGYLPGALTAGPAPAKLLKDYKIDRVNKENEEFNTNDIKYYDDRFNFITNEPTIVGNATALFVFGCFSN